jgi:hypothetical protein
MTFKDGVEAYANIQYEDTLEYDIELVSANSGDIIMSMQTTRLYPADSLGNMLVDLIESWYEPFGFVGPTGSGQPDTTKELLLRRIVPAGLSNEDVYIRLTPVFYGDYYERGLWRCDAVMGRRSNDMWSISQTFHALYDSIAAGDTLPRLAANLATMKMRGMVEEISIWPNPASGSVQISLRDQSSPMKIVIVGAASGTVYIARPVLTSENESLSIDISSLAPGKYFVIATNSDRELVSYRLLIIDNSGE